MGPTSFAKLFALISFLILTSSVYVQAAVIPALEDKGTDSDPVHALRYNTRYYTHTHLCLLGSHERHHPAAHSQASYLYRKC